MIQEKLEIEDVNIEGACRVSNTNNTLPRTIIAKFSNFKGKQVEDFSKKMMDIRKEKWKFKGNFRK